MKPGLVDRALDWTVVPGYSRVGFALRRRGWNEPDAAAAAAGRRVLVTGASSGIGAATCELLARGGARVEMVARNRERGERARERIAERSGSDRLELHLCDVSSVAAVRELAGAIAAEAAPLDALVNNAGAMPAERHHTPDGVELTFATNVLGPFCLTALLVPALGRSESGRVVNVSSGGMYTERLRGDDLQLERREYDPPAFYAHSKRCEVVLTELWAERLRDTGVSVHSMHPGWADTPGVRTSLPRFRRVMGPLLRNADQAADTIAWLATADEPGRSSGRFWHDRAVRPTHRLGSTRESPTDRERLWDECMRLGGLGPDEVPRP